MLAESTRGPRLEMAIGEVNPNVLEELGGPEREILVQEAH